MHENHPYTIHKVCPCDIGKEAVQEAIDIYKTSTDVASFVDKMERQRVIGKRIWYDEKRTRFYYEDVCL